MSIPKSKRTGGPRTVAGKLAVSGNALKHGAYTAQVVLPGESHADFQALADQFSKDFAPADVAESALVHQLAVVSWKRLRLNRVEHATLATFLQRQVDAFEVKDIRHLLPDGNAAVSLLNVLLHCTEDEQNAMAADVAHARKLAQKAAGYTGAHGEPLPWTTADWSALAAQASQVATWLAHWMHGHFPDQTDASQWHILRFKQPDGQHHLVMQKALDHYLREHADWVWLLDRPAKAHQALAHVQDARLSLFWNLHPMGRLHDELDRSFQRHLSELRRHQNWRRNQATVTITPESVVSSNQTNSQ